MPMDFIIIVIIAIVVVGVGAAVMWRRNPDNDSDTGAVSEQATQGTHNPPGPEPPSREAWPPAATPVPPLPTASASPDVARHRFETSSNSILRNNAPTGSVTTLWNDDTIHGFQERWGKVQLQFVDDPHNAATAAEALITDVIESLAATVHAQKSTLDAWRSSNGADTEELRMAMRRYREFLDRVLGA